MLWSRLSEPGDSPLLKHPPQFNQHLCWIRHMMKCIKANDAFDARIRKFEAAPIEQKKLRRWTIADWRMTQEQLLAHTQGSRRYVNCNHFAAELSQDPRNPASPGAKLEHRHPRTKLQAL